MVSRTTTLFHEVIFVVIHVRFITWREPSCKNGLSKYRCCVGAAFAHFMYGAAQTRQYCWARESEEVVMKIHVCQQIFLQTLPIYRKFSTTPINDCQLSCQKICQKISVIKTNSFDWELLTFDDIKK